jgi:hypothetical protein
MITEAVAPKTLTVEQETTIRAIVEQGRDAVIVVIKNALKQRSGKSWSVRGGRGTAWGWIDISALPARKVDYRMTAEDQAELSALLGKDVHGQGESVAASSEYYRVALARAMFGTAGNFTAEPYWD